MTKKLKGLELVKGIQSGGDGDDASAKDANATGDDGVIKTATFSECGLFRYTLGRAWDQTKPLVVFVGLNPSTADETDDDPTIRRCMGFAKAWGYGQLCMVNLFSFRATKPIDMKCSHNPVGENRLEADGFFSRNDATLEMAFGLSRMTICAWGNDGEFMGRAEKFRRLILAYKKKTGLKKNMYYLKMNKDGQPAHPLYLKKDLEPIEWADII